MLGFGIIAVRFSVCEYGTMLSASRILAAGQAVDIGDQQIFFAS